MSNIKINKFPVFKIDKNGQCTCYQPNCKSPGKHPTVKWRNYQGNEPSFEHNNIGITTGRGLLVIDVDPRNGGSSSLKELIALCPLPDTPTVSTPAGGLHFYYEVDEKIKSQNNFMPGIDIKCEGGYVLAPGSNHISGKIYEWEPDLSPEELGFYEKLPDQLIEHLTHQEEFINESPGCASIDDGQLSEIKQTLDLISADDYDHWLKVGMALKTITGRAMLPYNMWYDWSKKSKKFNPGEMQTKWNSFSGTMLSIDSLFWVAKQQGVNMASIAPIVPDDVDFMGAIDSRKVNMPKITEQKIEAVEKPTPIEITKIAEIESLYRTKIPEKFAFALELEEIFNKNMKQNPEYINRYLVTQIIPAMAFQDCVFTAKDGLISSYCLMIGKSGCGKSTVRKSILEILTKAGIELNSRPASGTALGQILETNLHPRILEDELLIFLNTMLNRDTDNLKGLMLQMYQGGETVTGQHAADSKYVFKKAVNPTLSMVGGGVTDEFCNMINNPKFMNAGFNTRLEFLMYPRRLKPLLTDDNDFLPAEIVTMLGHRIKESRAKLKSHQKPIRIDWADRSTKELWVDYSNAKREAISNEVEHWELMTRQAELAIRAASRLEMVEFHKDKKRPRIGMDALTFGIQHAQDNTDILIHQLVNLNNTPEQDFENKVIKTVQKYGRPITQNSLIQRLRVKCPDRFKFEKTLASLVAEGALAVSKNHNTIRYIIPAPIQLHKK